MLSSENAEWLGVRVDKLIGDFGNSHGLHQYDGNIWNQLSAADADNSGNTMVEF
jgi:hypothetical protein